MNDNSLDPMFQPSCFTLFCSLCYNFMKVIVPKKHMYYQPYIIFCYPIYLLISGILPIVFFFFFSLPIVLQKRFFLTTSVTFILKNPTCNTFSFYLACWPIQQGWRPLHVLSALGFHDTVVGAPVSCGCSVCLLLLFFSLWISSKSSRLQVFSLLVLLWLPFFFCRHPSFLML